MQTFEVEIKADFNSVLQAVNAVAGTELKPRPDGFHLTIIGPTESATLSTLDDATLAELQQINEQIQKGEGIVAKGIGFIDSALSQCTLRKVDEVKKTAFIAFDIPALQAFRLQVGLPQKDFHVTLGFEGGDINMHVVGQKPVKPGSSKMKDVLALVPKQADPRFGGVTLPEISYGGLDGQMKQRKHKETPFS